MSKLTPKQERFCLEYMKDGNASRAYRESYDAEKMLDATVNKRASELLKNGEIAGRLEELRKETSSNAIMSIQQRKEWLTRMIYEEDASISLKAMDILNKMEALYIQKQELSGEVNTVAKVIKIPLRKSDMQNG